MKKFIGFLSFLIVLGVVASAFTHKNFETKSTKVVGVNVIINNYSSHTLSLTFNGLTNYSFTVNAHTTFNNKILAQPNNIYTVTVNEGSNSFYFSDNTGYTSGVSSPGPKTTPPFILVDNYTLSAW